MGFNEEFWPANSTPGTLDIISSDELIVSVTARYALYRFALADSIRKMEPIEKAPIPGGHLVSVTPRTMDAPDIIKVVVQRNGVTVEPIATDLKPKAFSNRMGASTTLHAGTMMFACSAFAPNGIVTITAIPNTGTNTTRRLTLGEIRSMR